MILERRCEYCIYYNEEPSFSLYLFSSDCKKRDTCDIEIRDSIILRARTNVTKRYREQTYIRKYPESLWRQEIQEIQETLERSQFVPSLLQLGCVQWTSQLLLHTAHSFIITMSSASHSKTYDAGKVGGIRALLHVGHPFIIRR